MAVKGEKGFPVSAVNHWRCADMLSLQMNPASTCRCVLHLLIAFFYYQGTPGSTGDQGPRGPTGPQGSKGDKVVAD